MVESEEGREAEQDFPVPAFQTRTCVGGVLSVGLVSDREAVQSSRLYLDRSPLMLAVSMESSDQKQTIVCSYWTRGTTIAESFGALSKSSIESTSRTVRSHRARRLEQVRCPLRMETVLS